MKLSDQLDQLKRIGPKRSPHGQLYRLKAETKKRYYRVNLFTLFYSSEGSQAIRPHVFSSDTQARTPAEWNEWFNQPVNMATGRQEEPRTIKRLSRIYVKGVLPGLQKRTQKDWAVKSILGWVGDAVYKPVVIAVSSKRNKAKQKGRKVG